MSGIQISSLLLVIAALVSYLNERFIKMPGKTGHFLLSLVFALGIILCEVLQISPLHTTLRSFIDSVNFGEVLTDGMLSILLFAGGLHTPLRIFKENKRIIFGLAVLSTILNTFFVGSILWFLLNLIDIGITFPQALVFGALISPTDPLTAMAVLTKIGLPKRLETLFLGEALFNDGIGLVLFTAFSGLAFEPASASGGYDGIQLFLTEVGGGILMGLILAGIMHYLIRTSKDLYTNTLITVATVAGGYALSQALHVSGPIAMAVLGVLAGNFTFETKMPRSERHDIHIFWTILDDILTAVLFLLIGLQLVRIPFTLESVLSGVIAVGIVLFSRGASVLGALNVLFIEKPCSRPQFSIVRLLTWGGLRGGLSIAMALSLPHDLAIKPVILDMTLFVVTFSILVQGLTISKLYSQNRLQELSEEISP
jgi:Na+:H+ antiporter